MVKRFDIILSEKTLDFEEVPSLEGYYCFYEDADMVFQAYEHEILDLQEQLDELASDRDMWKDMYNALYEKSA